MMMIIIIIITLGMEFKFQVEALQTRQQVNGDKPQPQYKWGESCRTGNSMQNQNKVQHVRD